MVMWEERCRRQGERTDEPSLRSNGQFPPAAPGGPLMSWNNGERSVAGAGAG